MGRPASSLGYGVSVALASEAMAKERRSKRRYDARARFCEVGVRVISFNTCITEVGFPALRALRTVRKKLAHLSDMCICSAHLSDKPLDE